MRRYSEDIRHIEDDENHKSKTHLRSGGDNRQAVHGGDYEFSFLSLWFYEDFFLTDLAPGILFRGWCRLIHHVIISYEDSANNQYYMIDYIQSRSGSCN